MSCLLVACVSNATAVREGNMTFVVSNQTGDRLSITILSYDPLNLERPSDRQTNTLVLEPGATQQRVVVCRRQLAFGGEMVRLWGVEDQVQNTAAFGPEILFSDSSVPSTAAGGLAGGRGSAAPFNLQLGVDYSCGERVEVRFFRDAGRPGGYGHDVVLSPR